MMSTPLLIGVALVLAALPFLLLLPLRKRLDSQRIMLQDLQQAREAMEKEVHMLAQSLRHETKRIDQSVERLDELKKKTGQHFKAFDGELKKSKERLEDLSQRVEDVRSAPQISEPVANALTVDSPLVKDVLQMLEQGVEPTEIARVKGIQVGEIDLIRGLKKFARNR